MKVLAVFIGALLAFWGLVELTLHKCEGHADDWREEHNEW
jgi:hypothetical protein